MSGFVTIHRRIMKWEWYTDSNTVHLFFHCILRANHKDVMHKGIPLLKGDFISSISSLSSETGLTSRQVRTCINRLIVSGSITEKTTNKYRIITVCNYSDYQDKNEQYRQTNDKQTTNKRQTNDKQTTTDNNVNNDNNILDSYESNNADLKKKSVDKFVLPDGIRPDVWTAFVAMRIKIKRPMTEQAKSLIFKKLVTINQDTGQDPNDILEASIMHSWQGVFPLKNPKTTGESNENTNRHNAISALAVIAKPHFGGEYIHKTPIQRTEIKCDA